MIAALLVALIAFALVFILSGPWVYLVIPLVAFAVWLMHGGGERWAS